MHLIEIVENSVAFPFVYWTQFRPTVHLIYKANYTLITECGAQVDFCDFFFEYFVSHNLFYMSRVCFSKPQVTYY